MSTARQAAIANENRKIEESQSRAIAARTTESRPRNALEAMATKLEISPANLKKTLLNTVFAECKNEEQFMALIVVSNAYGLNPLTKEIYAFPAKGGGIVPMVSVDGWIRLMNEHPAFDGIEFDYTLDSKGSTTAIEAVIHRSDRKHPIKVMELMSECKGTTIPWTKSPSRMLRHRALIQCVRVAFGFSGIVAEGDEDVIEAQYRDVQPMTLPSRKTLADELGDEIPAFDKETGEIVDEPTRDPKTGMTRGDEETERQLDAGNDGTLSAENPTAAEGPADEDRGEAQVEEAPVWKAKFDGLMTDLRAVSTLQGIKSVEAEYLKHAVGFPKEAADEFEALLAEKKRAGKEG